MAIVFLQYSYVCTNGPIPFCIPEGILTQIFTWGRTRRGEFYHFLRSYGYGIRTQGLELGGTLSFLNTQISVCRSTQLMSIYN